MHHPYLSPGHHRCLCLVLGTKPLGRNSISCRMASVDDKVLEGSLEGSVPRTQWEQTEARDGWKQQRIPSGFQSFLVAETLPQPPRGSSPSRRKPTGGPGNWTCSGEFF